jgi:hypothetical protein
MSHYIVQEHNEKRFNRKHIDGYIRDAIQTDPIMQKKVQQGIKLVEQYINTHYTYTTKNGETKEFTSKNTRVAQLKNMDIEVLVTDIFVGIAYCQREELFTAVTAQMASRLRFSDKVEAITTIAELIAVLCNTDAFDIVKPDRMASLCIISRMPLSEKLITFIEESRCLPPMVIEPLELKSNFCSGYLTHNDSLVLGSGNHHDGDLCLDVLNLMNRVPLSLALDFLCKVEEEPTHELDTPEKIDNWKMFKRHSYQMYDLMASQGNVFYMTHKVDKRGRIYSQGYHINPQGAAFKKAMIELADQEYLSGVPSGY